jgi:hypothetical protein
MIKNPGHGLEFLYKVDFVYNIHFSDNLMFVLLFCRGQKMLLCFDFQAANSKPFFPQNDGPGEALGEHFDVFFLKKWNLFRIFSHLTAK